MKPMDETRRGPSPGSNRLAGTLSTTALVLLPLGGCSLAFVDGPSSNPSPSGNACTTSFAAPTLDLLGVPTTFVLGFGFGGFERSLDAIAPDDDDDTFGNLEKASLAASGALLVSSVYGLVQVRRCRSSREAGRGPPLLELAGATHSRAYRLCCPARNATFSGRLNSVPMNGRILFVPPSSTDLREWSSQTGSGSWPISRPTS